MPPKRSRFVSTGGDHDRRRAVRTRMRTLRKKTKRSDVDTRAGNRGAPLECCGKMRSNCLCFAPGGDGVPVRRAFKRSLANRFAKSLNAAEIVTDQDVADVPYIVRTLCYNNDRDQLCWLWGSANTLRYYNSVPTIDIVAPVLTQKRYTVNAAPDFDHLERALQAAYQRAKNAKTGDKLHGGLFRTTILSSYSVDGGVTWMEAPKDGVKRDLLGLRQMWMALPRAILQCYQDSPSRDFFKAALRQFQQNLSNVQKGMFGDYLVKCMLDVVVMSGAVVAGTISAWPSRCPAYLSAIPKFYPGIPADRWFLAFCHWHQFLRATRNMSFPAALAQLCWNERRGSGVLRDGAPGA